MATNPVALHPWDDEKMVSDLMVELLGLPRIRLDRVQDEPGLAAPGAYLQFVTSRRPEVVQVLGPVVAAGEYPAYAGVAKRSLRERLGRYRQSLADVEAIDETDVHVALVPCASAASACFVEAACHEALYPLVLNELGGWGQKRPGSTRRQRVSPTDALWPGKWWAPAATTKDRAMALLRVVAVRTALDPNGPRWPGILAPQDGGGVDDQRER